MQIISFQCQKQCQRLQFMTLQDTKLFTNRQLLKCSLRHFSYLIGSLIHSLVKEHSGHVLILYLHASQDFTILRIYFSTFRGHPVEMSKWTYPTDPVKPPCLRCTRTVSLSPGNVFSWLPEWFLNSDKTIDSGGLFFFLSYFLVLFLLLAHVMPISDSPLTAAMARDLLIRSNDLGCL